MRIVALDTNVLLDLFLERPTVSTYRTLFQQAQEGRCEFYISDAVLLEFEWVARSFYAMTKEWVTHHLQAIVELPLSNRDDARLLADAVLQFQKHRTVSFTDCVILVRTIDAGANSLVTGDRKLARLYASLRGGR
jgi:predicted nucleic-acid-binding protein